MFKAFKVAIQEGEDTIIDETNTWHASMIYLNIPQILSDVSMVSSSNKRPCILTIVKPNKMYTVGQNS